MNDGTGRRGDAPGGWRVGGGRGRRAGGLVAAVSALALAAAAPALAQTDGGTSDAVTGTPTAPNTSVTAAPRRASDGGGSTNGSANDATVAPGAGADSGADTRPERADAADGAAGEAAPMSAEEQSRFEVTRGRPPGRRRSSGLRPASGADRDRGPRRGRPDSGFYLSGTVALDMMADADVTSSAPGLVGLSPTLEPKLGYVVGGAAGWKLGNGLRGEVEVNYFRSEFDSIELGGVTRSVDDVHVTGFASLANVAYDFRFGFAERWVPYVGAGAGLAFVDSELERIGGTATGFATDGDLVFAWQAMAGLGFRVSPRLMVGADYRYFATAEPDFGAYKADIGVHRFAVNVRFGF